ncbi:hypothetical protein EDB19DRAFT_1898004 [Suillus lakei]|nr:hypothetical protein EDB19DRAFT_1898004 [Suillus lakei]
MASSFPYTPTTLRTSVKPRSWVPLKHYEGHVEVPSLPFKPRTDDLLGMYNISTHIIPAANPRVTPNTADREANVSSKGITLFLVHSTGSPKEIWETTLCYLLAACGVIDEIWSWESVQHGDSALLNRQNLSGTFDRTDNARDIANFLINYMPEEVETSAMPIQLHRLPASISEALALNFPTLFSSMILIDPMIDTYTEFPWEHIQLVVGLTLVRREQWPSREDAFRSFKSSPMFSAWHPDVLQLFVDYGLYECGSGSVRLKTPPIHEAIELMERLDENIELLWILPGKETREVSMMERVSKERVWRRPANSSNIIIKSSDHLIPQESPEALAQIMADFLHRKYGVASMQSKL